MRYSGVESTYILGNFSDGDTVTIDIYKLSDSSKVVDAASCSEIGTLGVFEYNFSQTISAKEEYLWIMSNGSSDQRGKIVLGGYPDGIKNETDKIQPEIIDVKDSFKATGFATENPPSQNLDDYKADVTNLDVAVSTRNATTPPTVEEIRVELEGDGTKLTGVKTQTDKMLFDANSHIESIAQNSELANLDVPVSSCASQTSLNQIPTNPLLDNDPKLSHLDADISSRSSQSGVQQNTDLLNVLLDIEQGNWEIDPNTKEMIFYNRSGLELMRFKLYNDAGVLSVKNVFKRVRQ